MAAAPLASDWFVVEVHWHGLQDEPLYHLSGVATGHATIPDGHRFISTALQWVDQTNQQALSRNSLYRLGPELAADHVRALDLQRINDYLAGLWSPPRSTRLILTFPRSLLIQNRH